eukprot:15084942-Alexandrium_andersonii.AAC.1
MRRHPTKALGPQLDRKRGACSPKLLKKGSAEVGELPSEGPDKGGAALRAAPPAPGSECGGSPSFTDSEPRRG